MQQQGAECTQCCDAASMNNASAFKSDGAEGLHNLLTQQQHQHQHATLIHSKRQFAAEIGTDSVGPILTALNENEMLATVVYLVCFTVLQ